MDMGLENLVPCVAILTDGMDTLLFLGDPWFLVGPEFGNPWHVFPKVHDSTHPTKVTRFISPY